MHRYHVTQHALDRYYERCGKRPIDLEISEAIPFGIQIHDGWYLQLPCGLVAAGRTIQGEYGWVKTILTVLTLDQAIANCQAKRSPYRHKGDRKRQPKR